MLFDRAPSRLYRLIMKSILVALLLGTLLAACGKPYEFHGTLLESTAPTYNITGVDVDGSTFQLNEQRGRFVLLNFGYTSCPDICPLTLGELAAVYSQLGEKDADYVDKLAVAFVTVDPERDTPERLQTYLGAFNPDFHGVYIEDAAELERVKGSFGIYAEKRAVEGSQNPANYLVDHTGGVYVIDPDGNVRLYLRNDIGVPGMVADLEHLLRS